MANEVKEIAEIIKKTKILLLDVEGTTTSISFVKDKLFPYAEENVKGYLESQWETDDTKEAVAALRKLALEDQEKSVDGAVAIPGEDASKEDQIEGLVNNVKWQMSSDRKAGALKLLQGLIWKQGYDSGDIKGHVYDDVSAALEQWRSVEGQKVYIYSSGSVQAQKLLFGQSLAGDLLKFIDGHFDTAVGPKQEAASYAAITEKIGVKPEEVLFLTDIVKEAEAARSAGLHAALVSREGNAPLPAAAGDAFAVLHSLAQLTATNKRKNEPQSEQPAKVLKTDTNDDVKSSSESVSENKTVEVKEKEQNMEVEEIPVAQNPPNQEIQVKENATCIKTVVDDIAGSTEPVDVPMLDINDEKTELKNTLTVEAKETLKSDGNEDSSNPHVNFMIKSKEVLEIAGETVAKVDMIVAKADEVLVRADEVVAKVDEAFTKADEVVAKAGEIATKVDVVFARAGEVMTKFDAAAVKVDEVIVIANQVLKKSDEVAKMIDEVEMEPDEDQMKNEMEMKIDEAEMKPDDVEKKSDEDLATPDTIVAMSNDNAKSIDVSVSTESAITLVEPIENKESIQDKQTEKTEEAEEIKQDLAEQVIKDKANDTEENQTTVVTEIEEITVDISDVAEMMDDLEPVVEEPPNEDIEDLQNVGEVLQKECDEILSKVQDVTNLDNIPLKPLLNTIAEETMETEIEMDAENMDSNDIVDRILDTEIELEIKQCGEMNLKLVSEIKSDMEANNGVVTTVDETNSAKIEENSTKNDIEVTIKSEIKSPMTNEKLDEGKSEDNVQEDKKIETTDKVNNDNAEKNKCNENVIINNDKNNIAEKEIAENSVKEENKEEKTEVIEGDKMETNDVAEATQITRGEESKEIPTDGKDESLVRADTMDTEMVPEEAKNDVEVEMKTKVNGKSENGDSETVNLNGDARKAEELSSRLSVENGNSTENGKETVNGSNGDSVSTEKGQGDKMEAETSEIKVKTVATEEIDRTDPIEKPTEV